MKRSTFIEKKRHGSPDFPIQYYYVDKHHPHYVMPAHWHREFEIIRVLSGRFTVFLNNVKYELNADDVLFVNGGYLHHGIPDECVYECVVFDLNMLKRQQNDAADPYLSSILDGSLGTTRPFNRDDSTIYASVCALCERLSAADDYYKLAVYAALFTLLCALYKQNALVPLNKSPHTQQARNISLLMDWIDAHYAEHITLDTLSELTGLNPKYLCGLFKEYTSKTVMEYLTDLRIQHACNALMNKNVAITSAAFDNGFNDLSYFCKVFKKKTGMTPREYVRTSRT